MSWSEKSYLLPIWPHSQLMTIDRFLKVIIIFVFVITVATINTVITINIIVTINIVVIISSIFYC